MAVEKQAERRPIPPEILEILDSGKFLTEAQLRELISIEAEWIGLTFDEAIELGRQNRLPKNDIGTDLWFLIRLLDA